MKAETEKTLRPLTPEELDRAEQRLRHPAPGSKIEAARKYGVDLTLIEMQLRLTPAERVRTMQDAAELAQKLRGAALRSKS